MSRSYAQRELILIERACFYYGKEVRGFNVKEPRAIRLHFGMIGFHLTPGKRHQERQLPEKSIRIFFLQWEAFYPVLTIFSLNY
jgi:hypothetical protein